MMIPVGAPGYLTDGIAGRGGARGELETAHRTHNILFYPNEKARECKAWTHWREDSLIAVWQCADRTCGFGICDRCFKTLPPARRRIEIEKIG